MGHIARHNFSAQATAARSRNQPAAIPAVRFSSPHPYQPPAPPEHPAGKDWIAAALRKVQYFCVHLDFLMTIGRSGSWSSLRGDHFIERLERGILACQSSAYILRSHVLPVGELVDQRRYRIDDADRILNRAGRFCQLRVAAESCDYIERPFPELYSGEYSYEWQWHGVAPFNLVNRYNSRHGKTGFSYLR